MGHLSTRKRYVVRVKPVNATKWHLRMAAVCSKLGFFRKKTASNRSLGWRTTSILRGLQVKRTKTKFVSKYVQLWTLEQIVQVLLVKTVFVNQ